VTLRNDRLSGGDRKGGACFGAGAGFNDPVLQYMGFEVSLWKVMTVPEGGERRTACIRCAKAPF
jgi:hypothetical protein